MKSYFYGIATFHRVREEFMWVLIGTRVTRVRATMFLSEGRGHHSRYSRSRIQESLTLKMEALEEVEEYAGVQNF